MDQDFSFEYTGVYSTVEWDFGDNNAVSTQDAPNYEFSQPGTYTIGLTVNDAESGKSKTVYKDVFIANYDSTRLMNGFIVGFATDISIPDEGEYCYYEDAEQNNLIGCSEGSFDYGFYNSGDQSIYVNAKSVSAGVFGPASLSISDGPWKSTNEQSFTVHSPLRLKSFTVGSAWSNISNLWQI